MTRKREDSFPATSIGRTAGFGFQRATAAIHATDSLTAHPLNSPNRSSSPSPSDVGGGPRYLPYTPRQRVSASTTTTGTTVQPASSSPQHQHGDATSKLQVVHLKAAAQNFGLDTGSVGWGILERLVYSEGDAEWTEIWDAVTLGKVCIVYGVCSILTRSGRRRCCCRRNLCRSTTS